MHSCASFGFPQSELVCFYYVEVTPAPSPFYNSSTNKLRYSNQADIMKDTTPAQTSATNNNNGSSSSGGSKKKKRKFNNSKKKIPKVGDPDYLSPTQLRNRRKRRAKKQQKQEAQPQSKEEQQQESSFNPKRSSNNKSGKSGNSNNEALKDPSMKYINYPTKAPIIRTAKKYLEPLLENNTFNVYIGPLYRWRTVSNWQYGQITMIETRLLLDCLLRILIHCFLCPSVRHIIHQLIVLLSW